MVKNYFTVALRSLLRNKSYAVINITGLTLGITTCLIIFLIITREMSYDSFHPDSNRIFRVAREVKSNSGIDKSSATPYPFAAALRSDFPDLTSITEFHSEDHAMVTVGDEKTGVKNILFADTAFFKVFGFGALSGNPEKELAEPGKVFLSEEFAKRSGIKTGQHIKLNSLIELDVAGIIKTPPSPSHIEFAMIASFPSLTPEFTHFPLDRWPLTANAFTYVKLQKNATASSIESRLPKFLEKYFPKEDGDTQRYLLQPLSGIHFNTEFTPNPGVVATSVSTLYVLGAIGLFILIIACVNFINLTTALSFKKSKEAGVRKTLGAEQKQLVFQFLSETLLITAVSAVLATGIAEWAAPLVGAFLDTDLHLNLFSNLPVVAFLIATVLLTSVFSGLYPSLVLARFSPVKALKNKVNDPASSSHFLRKSLVVLQFFIAQVLIICTLVVSGQLNYFRNSSMGFAKESVINLQLPENSPEVIESFRNKLMANPEVTDVSISLGAPVSDNKVNTFAFLNEKGADSRHDITLKATDFNYMSVYGLELKEGRWFLESEVKQASTGAFKERHYTYIVTEATCKLFGFSNPKDIIGKVITSGLYDAEGPVVGVIKDFHSNSLKTEINPIVMIPFPSFYFDVGVKMSGNNRASTMTFIESTWQQQFPSYLYKYEFLDEFIGKLYEKEEKMFTLFEVFAGIAILIGCLGLYGLASYMASQRTKEVAIRKTMGASVGQIIGLFSKQFILLVIVAFVIAAPVSWYAMHEWLQTFAYQNGIGWTVFASGISFTLAIAFVTVGYRSMKAAVFKSG